MGFVLAVLGIIACMMPICLSSSVRPQPGTARSNETVNTNDNIIKSNTKPNTNENNPNEHHRLLLSSLGSVRSAPLSSQPPLSQTASSSSSSQLRPHSHASTTNGITRINNGIESRRRSGGGGFVLAPGGKGANSDYNDVDDDDNSAANDDDDDFDIDDDEVAYAFSDGSESHNNQDNRNVDASDAYKSIALSCDDQVKLLSKQLSALTQQRNEDYKSLENNLKKFVKKNLLSIVDEDVRKELDQLR